MSIAIDLRKLLLLSLILTLFILLFSGKLSAQDGVKHLSHPNLNTWQPPSLPQLNNFDNFTVTRTDFTITMSDGVIIDALKFIPIGTPPAGGWPTVIMVHGYGDNKNTLAGFCQAQAEYGYYTMTFSVRGQGQSGGVSNLISRTEMNDFIQIVSRVKADSINGSNPNNILVMGGSQGGALPFMAACNDLNVKTVISALAPPNFASSWIENGCIKMTLLWTLDYTPDTARYSNECVNMRNWIFANTKPLWDSLARVLPRNRDFMTQVPNCHVPILIEGGWQDKFFNVSGLIQAGSLITSPFKSYLGAVVGHGGDQSATESTWHMQLFNDWFFYWLFGQQNGTMSVPKYQYASTTFPFASNQWSFRHDSSAVWPVSTVRGVKLYLNTSAYLDTIPNGNSSNKVSLANQVTGGLTMTEAVNLEFKGTTFTTKFKKKSIVFDTDYLTEDVQMTGVPRVKLDYLSTAGPFAQFNVQLIELPADNNEYFVNRLNYTDRNYTANQRKSALFEGQAHSHIFKRGSQIRIKITNLDTNPKDTTFFRSNPFVLPVLINAAHSIYLSANSYIELPIKGGVLRTSETPVIGAPIHQENTQTTAPGSYGLEQNYPNPFNPVTKINYSIGSANLVQIKVFDITGREVRTLINDFQQPGSYSVEFNAGELASGVYFYKIISGSYQNIKKMLVVK